MLWNAEVNKTRIRVLLKHVEIIQKNKNTNIS